MYYLKEKVYIKKNGLMRELSFSDFLNCNGEIYNNFLLSQGLNLHVEITIWLLKTFPLNFSLWKRISVLRQIPNGGVNILDMKCNNSYIRKCLNQYISCYPKAILKWKPFFSFSMPSSETIWSASNTFLQPNKVKETHFKIQVLSL